MFKILPISAALALGSMAIITAAIFLGEIMKIVN